MIRHLAPPSPFGCRWCGIDRRSHGRQWTQTAGWHAWEQPTEQQILARMRSTTDRPRISPGWTLMTRQPTAPAPPTVPTPESGPVVWHTIIDIHGHPYPTRNFAPDIEGDSDVCLNLTAPQLNYLRAIHEAGHAVTALLGGAHLHSAEIVLGELVGESGGVVYACNLADGHGYAIFSAAGERAADRWLRESGLWTPGRGVAAEVGACLDRRLFLAINPHVGFGDREVDYLVVHDLADKALGQHWAGVVRVADRLAQQGRLDAAEIEAITGLPNGTASSKCPLRSDCWEETPAEAAAWDRCWGQHDDEDDNETEE